MQSILERWRAVVLSPFRCTFTVPVLQPNLVLKAPRPLPDLPLEIWLDIFQFATYVHHSETIRPINPFAPRRITTNVMGANTPSLAMRTKLSLVLVCRSWRRLAVQILYRHIVIRSPARADAVLLALEHNRNPTEACPSTPGQPLTVAQSQGYGEWTRHIEVYTHMRGSANISFLQTIFKIFHCCPNLLHLTGNWMHHLPKEFVQAVSKMFGPSVLGLYWTDPDADSFATPDFLGNFQSLQVLDLRHFGGGDLTERSPDSSRPRLPCVQDLILSTEKQSLQVAAAIDLPKLHNLTLRTRGHELVDNEHLTAFLRVHGQSLILVDLPPPSDTDLDIENAPVRRNAEYIPPDIFLAPNVCPNLESFVYSCTGPSHPTHPHPNLRRVGIRGITAEFLYPDKETFVKSHLRALNPEKYPRLELVQMIGFLVDAHADSIMKDACIWWVEKFEKRGILFLDGECVLWMYAEQEETINEQVATKVMEERQPHSQPNAMKKKDRCPSDHLFALDY